jgi:polynucleotide 5'-kinase involved in rRNA processing
MSTPSTSDAIARAAMSSKAFLIGGMDTGKTTLAVAIAREALSRGRTVALVDADIGNSTIGPPACVGLKFIRTEAEVADRAVADRLHFVGGISPDRLVLQHVIATTALAQAGAQQADLVIVDTTGTVSGVIGQTLKYHKVELIRPDLVLALQRGGELEPVVGMLRRFFAVEVVPLPADPDVLPSAPDARAAARTRAFGDAFAEPLDRWRVRETVFAPTLPMGLDLNRLDGVLVGVQDGSGGCLGLGRLEYRDEVLRVVTNAGEGMQGLRLGSLRLDLDTMDLTAVNLRELIFGI